MKTLNLREGDWQLRSVGESEWITVSIPGEVHVALMQAGKIPNPFEADNEHRVQWVAQRDWVFKGNIHVPGELLEEDRVWLCFDGLDTLAEVSVNDSILGETDNAFRTYSWEVKELLKPGNNVILVNFKSPVNFVSEKQKKQPLPSPDQSIPGGPHLRKAPCQWGWDWGPMLPPIGIWKDARLEAYSIAKLESIHLRQEHQFPGRYGDIIPS